MASVSVSAGFKWPDGNCVASTTVSWGDDLYVTVGTVRYSYTNGSAISAECKWRIKSPTGSIVAGYSDSYYIGDSFQATSGYKYTFQACVSGPYPWGNSTVEEGKDGSSYFTVKADSGGGGGSVTPETYTITYNANGGSGAPSSQTKTEDQTITLRTGIPTKSSVPAGSIVITFDPNSGECDQTSHTTNLTTNYTFLYWNTKSDGSGTTYYSGGKYYYNADLTLYAIYEGITTTPDPITLPSAFKDGYDFAGWNSNKNATSGTTGSYTPKKNITLYAIYKPLGFIYIYDGGGFNAYQVFIFDGSSWDMYCPYVYDEGWSMCS